MKKLFQKIKGVVVSKPFWAAVAGFLAGQADLLETAKKVGELFQ